MEYKIEKNIPVPAVETFSVEDSPLHKLDVGDSFKVPYRERRVWSARAHRHKLRTGRVFTVRTISDKEARVWRIK